MTKTFFSINILTFFILFFGCAGPDTPPEPPVEIKTNRAMTLDKPPVDTEALFQQNRQIPSPFLKSSPVDETTPAQGNYPGKYPGTPSKFYPEAAAIMAAAPPVAENQAPGQGDASTGDIVFNFDNADLYEVIRTMADLLRINYIVDPGVRGNVTIHTAGRLRKEELFTVFYQVLEANGLTAVQEGSLYKIIPLKDSPRMPLRSGFGTDAAESAPGERIVMQIIPLRYISTQEMTKLLTPFISADGTIISHGDSNTLLLVDKDINILKALKLIQVFDVDIFEKAGHRFYPVRHMTPDEMAKLLNDILSAYGKANRPDTKLIPLNHLSMLLLISPDPDAFKKIESFIPQLDVPQEDDEPKIHVYFVKNGDAEDLGNLLNDVFSSGSESQASENKNDQQPDTGESGNDRPFTPPNPFANKTAKETPGKEAARPDSSSFTSILSGKIKITTDKIRNALIIEATPADYQVVEGILRRIDVLPRQVMIEVIIAEISLDGKEELGVEWEYKKGDGGSLSTSLLSGQWGASGLQFIVGEAERWTAAFSALASENKLNILSAPVVLASDNKEASINVSDQIPVASAEYLYDSGSNGVTQTNIQYRDTGIILTVTPHINERGLVSMEVSQEVSEQGEGVNVGDKSYPSFRERSVSTTLTVRHSQTIVIGGLMREKKTKTVSGVPMLSRLPGIGFLFGKDAEERSKTELILLITPRVIISLEDVNAVTEEFTSRVDYIRGQNQKMGLFPSPVLQK
jgi:general secretion pathway protein D